MGAGFLRATWFLQAGLLVLVTPVAAQLRFGEVSADSNGIVSAGYTASYGNMTAAEHNWTVGGSGTLTGSFHNPNFLSFNANLYLNQSRANSDFQSISDASGINLSTNIFNGSKFPGSITYSKAYNSEGNYAVPGLANFVTHGDSGIFGINWNENLPDKPSLSAGFQLGSSQYSVYGTNDEGSNAFHSLTLHSSYRLAGFNLGAYYTNGADNSQIPQVIVGQLSNEIHSNDSSYGFNASTLLPLKGSFSAGINRSQWDSEYLGTTTNGTIDLFNAQTAIHPLNRLSLSFAANYSDNLAGQLILPIVTAGGVAPGINTSESSNSLDLLGAAGYTPAANVQTTAFVERRTQNFLGETYGVNSYGGSATYAHGLLDGTFNCAGSITANSSDNTGEDTLGFSGSENYSTQIMGWHVTESFGYAQNAQTLLVTYTSSSYNYSGDVRRRWGQFNVSAGAGGARTALTQVAGSASSGQSYNGSMGYGVWLTATGSYSKASGQVLATGSGFVPVPLPPPILPASLVSVFGGDSYSVGLSSTPVKRLIIAAAYAKSNSSTSGPGIMYTNENEQLNSLIQYRYRKLNFTSGYARLEQGFSTTGLPPEVISTYYVGVSRWFSFF